MDYETTSLTEGTFLFKPPGFKIDNKKKSKKKVQVQRTPSKWESAYNKIWGIINHEVEEINKQSSRKALKDLAEHFRSLPNRHRVDKEIIPCAILVTGLNLPDHQALLSNLTGDLELRVSPFLVSLWSYNCTSIRELVHTLVSEVIPTGPAPPEPEQQPILGYRKIDINVAHKNYLDMSLRRSQFNMPTLASWYACEYRDYFGKRPCVIVIVHDFENFVPSLLADLITLLSFYCSLVPFRIIFMVSTTPITVYQSLPGKALAKLIIKVFRSDPSAAVYNRIFEDVLLNEKCPFRLGEKCINLLTDIFLFHSFSVKAILQGIRFMLIEHLYKRNHYALCCKLDEVSNEVDQLSREDIENIRRIDSFKRFVENRDKDERTSLLLDDDYTREVIKTLMTEVLEHSRDFHLGLNILWNLVGTLPRSPLAKNLKELYCICISRNLHDSDEFKECMTLLGMQSKSELIFKIDRILDLFGEEDKPDDPEDTENPENPGNSENPENPGNSENTGNTENPENPENPDSVDSFDSFDDTPINYKRRDLYVKLMEFRKQMDSAAASSTDDTSEEKMEANNVADSFEEARTNFLAYIEEILAKDILRTPKGLPLYEIVYFDDEDNVEKRIVAAPRFMIHLALNDPQYYLNCNCCFLSREDDIPPTLPDLAIAYKIHVEHNKIINMYDWLQSFAAVLKANGTCTDNSDEEDKNIQARFTRAVSELQFLGFIKPSQVKADHMTRLTWEQPSFIE